MKIVLLLFCLLPAQAALVKIYSGVPANAGNLSPGPLNFSGDTLAGSFFAPDINFGSLNTNWVPLGLTNNFGADITATINVASAGSYTFNTTSDDGSVLLIDGQEIVNNNQYQGATERSGSINLTAGLHTMEVQYFQGVGGSDLQATLPAGISYIYEQPTLAVYQDPSPLTVANNGEVPPPLVPSGALLAGGIAITSPNGVSFGLPDSNWHRQRGAALALKVLQVEGMREFSWCRRRNRPAGCFRPACSFRGFSPCGGAYSAD